MRTSRPRGRKIIDIAIAVLVVTCAIVVLLNWQSLQEFVGSFYGVNVKMKFASTRKGSEKADVSELVNRLWAVRNTCSAYVAAVGTLPPNQPVNRAKDPEYQNIRGAVYQITKKEAGQALHSDLAKLSRHSGDTPEVITQDCNSIHEDVQARVSDLLSSSH